LVNVKKIIFVGFTYPPSLYLNFYSDILPVERKSFEKSIIAAKETIVSFKEQIIVTIMLVGFDNSFEIQVVLLFYFILFLFLFEISFSLFREL
jgi:hypothetical protein